MDVIVDKIEPADKSKKSARMFTFGNLIAVSFPPFFVLWFGASILVYAIYRHHPNKRVGYYTQIAAYYYYAMAGLLVPLLTFAPDGFLRNNWVLLWAIYAVVMVILSFFLLRKINNEVWEDVHYKGKE
ncbi:hypothetical protein [Leucothrix pacifica]|uniref:DUF4870 domain-containing protein n=1 Tax=Leucothrix pacifica TaxID=1247513 RepID=A0A317CR58_9GAMM|nr:hypothetical protein [Leucothrix pacifica]PWR00024.1 hypothetical protein DKW60_02455 [Leucothrix pacifica]